MRLSDAGLHQRQSKAVYLSHRLPPLPDEDPAPRSLEPIVRSRLRKTLKSSQSRVAKMEAGDPTVSLDLLVKSILALGASNRELAAIIAKS
jgi:hypothetical protein